MSRKASSGNSNPFPKGSVRLSAAVALALLFPGGALAGEVYGRLWVVRGEERSVAQAAEVRVQCPEEPEPTSTPSDENGSYRLLGIGSGKCWLQVSYDGKDSNKIPLYLSEQRTRANLELRRNDDGWSVARR